MSNLVVFQKPLVQKYDPAYVCMIYYIIGSFFTLLLSICWYFRFTLNDFYFNNHYLPWLALAYVSIVATLFCYNAISYCIRKVSASVTTVYSTLQPVGTVLLSILFFNQLPTWPECLGGIFVAIGLILTVHGRIIEQKQKREDYLRKRTQTDSSADLISNNSKNSKNSKNSSTISSVLSQDDYRVSNSASFNHTLDIVYNIHNVPQIPNDDIVYGADGIQHSISPIQSFNKNNFINNNILTNNINPLMNPFLSNNNHIYEPINNTTPMDDDNNYNNYH